MPYSKIENLYDSLLLEFFSFSVFHAAALKSFHVELQHTLQGCSARLWWLHQHLFRGCILSYYKNFSLAVTKFWRYWRIVQRALKYKSTNIYLLVHLHTRSWLEVRIKRSIWWVRYFLYWSTMYCVIEK